jgi:hypothetical protein
MFYENNLRSISVAGVDVVMRTFFEQHAPDRDAGPDGKQAQPERETSKIAQAGASRAAALRVQCEEELADAFAP